MVINLLIVSCHCYADEEESSKRILLVTVSPGLYGHAAEGFKAVRDIAAVWFPTQNTLLKEETFFMRRITAETFVFLKEVSIHFECYNSESMTLQARDCSLYSSSEFMLCDSERERESKGAAHRQTRSLFRVQLLSNATVRSEREIQKSDTDRFFHQ